jgi:ribosomal protein S18 acetylase RimI-like enzyme
MVAILSSINLNSHHIRKMNMATDLDKVADLIEMCFPIHKDPDGQSYIREMRQASREMRMLGWLSRLAEFDNLKAAGFVWDQEGQIIGNLSLIPFREKGRRIHLIANVAVHPNFRRKGIARALTERALSYLKRQNDPYVWLQVKEDNPGAVNLYREVGFVDQVTRTTWRIRPFERQPEKLLQPSGLKVRNRVSSDWHLQQSWLKIAYPEKIRWNLGVDFNRFEPGFVQGLSNFLEGIHIKHWQVELDGRCCGFISWQKTSSFANNLWLAFSPEDEREVLPGALEAVIRLCTPNHPLSIDYPKARQQSIFERIGFSHFRTLIWMKQDLK